MCDATAIAAWFAGLQGRLVARLAGLDPAARRRQDAWQRPGGGGGLTVVLTGGDLIEKGGINFSHIHGEALPPAATAARPQLAGRPFTASGVSVVFHPLNPYVPATHMNVRHITVAGAAPETPVWWFGGGFDLTPVYPFVEDIVAWHAAARAACEPFGADLYPRFKAACDAYFHLPHRGETRGVGGLFFDDHAGPDPERAFALVRSVAEAFLPAWAAIALRRRDTPWGERQKAFQRYRRGRYAEFNLMHDRGTRFGLQSGGRTESILMSLPPAAEWIYDYQPEPGSPEAALGAFLQPRDWLGERERGRPQPQEPQA